MSVQFVLLWSDALLFVLIGVIVALTLWARRQDALRAAWVRVARNGVAMAAATVLAVFVLIGVLDSLHYRARLEDQAGAAARYSVEVNSALDALLADLRQRTEKTYSAPLATHLFAREALENSTQREFPRLKHGGAHLGEDLSGHEFDIALRLSRGLAGGLVVWLLLKLLVRRTKVGAGDTALGAVLATLLAILLLIGAAIALGGGYHVFGTDKVGQDVLYLSLKSIRTGLLIGTLTTLVMLPVAVLLGILAGYVGGWVDDLIQYLYTTLSSIPGVLLIAAAVLMMQVVIDTHPDWFATSAERADARLLALCLILAMTSWTGVARLLRGETLKLRELEFVQAAQAFGVSRFAIMRRHILPNLMHIVVISLVMDFSGLVLAEAVLSYVGVGVDPTTISFGTMINTARMELAREPMVWWSLLAAFSFMFALVLAANLFADAVRDAFDPEVVGMSILSVKDLAIHIGAARPVDGISFDIAAGECFALLGESGCGKSMTALGIMRLLPLAAQVTGGVVAFEGRDLLTLPESGMREVRGGGVGMIFQEPATSLNPVLTVGRQIIEALQLHAGLQGAAGRVRAGELLEQVGIPDPMRRLDEYPFQLSGGLRQRVMIACALAGAPRLLIADEPTTALDVTIQAQVLDLLDELRRKQGMALLLITHDLGVVARMADRVGVMYAGQLVEEAPRKAFFRQPAHPYSVRLFAALPDANRRGGRLATIPGSVPAADLRHAGCRFVARCSEVMPACHSAPPPWREVEAGQADQPGQPGQRVRCFLPGLPPGVAAKVGADDTALAFDSQPILAVTDLQVHFPIRRGMLQRVVGAVRAVDGVSLQIMPGRTLALVGESGCGKTTAGKAMLQLLRPTAGSVLLDGVELTTRSSSELRPLRAKMQMVFQDPFASLNPRLRIGDIIAEGMQALKVMRSGIPGDGAGDAAPIIGRLLEQVGLRADMAGRYPHEFSGGQRQRIAIARALAVNPQLLICDEPTSALDVSVQAQILNLLSDLQRDLKLAYLFITHNIAVVDYLAHDVAVMYLGRVVERGTADEVLRQTRHPYTQALLAAVPRIDGLASTAVKLSGDMPSAAKPPAGCHFHPRCPLADEGCRRSYPVETLFGATHAVRCFKAT